MKVRVIWAVAALFVAIALVSCGGPTCTQQVNTSPGTIGTGQMFIVTNHSVYAPGNLIQATINNHLQVPIIVNNVNSTAYCPYFELQMRAGTDWLDIDQCVAASGDTEPRNDPKRIEAGGSFTTGLHLHTDLSAGTYRLRIISYRILAQQSGAIDSGTAESATFRICACRVCA